MPIFFLTAKFKFSCHIHHYYLTCLGQQFRWDFIVLFCFFSVNSGQMVFIIQSYKVLLYHLPFRTHNSCSTLYSLWTLIRQRQDCDCCLSETVWIYAVDALESLMHSLLGHLFQPLQGHPGLPLLPGGKKNVSFKMVAVSKWRTTAKHRYEKALMQ